ncbi:MAG: YheC/YheD family protein [Pseudomonadota bacterium]
MPRAPECWIGVLVPAADGGPLRPPEARPLGRAALALAGEGIGVVFGEQIEGGRMTGLVAVRGGWQHRARVPLVALHDRFPSQTFPERFAAGVAGAGGLPVGNPPALTALCRDKLACQAWLEGQGLVLPPVEAEAARFASVLEAWGAGFLKPRYGGLGRGVRRVNPGDALPAEGEGAVPGLMEPLFLQRAVQPPAGWAGWSLRVLVQRTEEGGWTIPARVLRRSREDPVVNVARGADVGLADAALPVGALVDLDRLALVTAAAIARAPGCEPAVEVGVDAVLGADGGLHLIEVNGRPQGRLEVLAAQDPERWEPVHLEACARPLRVLAALPRWSGRRDADATT